MTALRKSSIALTLLFILGVFPLSVADNARAENRLLASGLSECIPSVSDACADTAVARDIPKRIKPQSKTFRIQQSQELADQAVAGDYPQTLKPDAKSQSTDKANANTKITIQNNTSKLIYWRLFAVRGSNVYAWPSAARVYVSKRYSSSSANIACIRGETLIFGATTSDGMVYYGVGVDGQNTCLNPTGCSYKCNGGTVRIPLMP